MRQAAAVLRVAGRARRSGPWPIELTAVLDARLRPATSGRQFLTPAFCACTMIQAIKQITVRNIPVAVSAKLRSLAAQTGLSLNQTVIQLLETATGGKPEVRKRDLSAIAGEWSDREADRFDRAIVPFESVDEEVWG